MKNFNLNKAKQGVAITTKEGKDVKIIYYNRESPHFPIVVIINEIDVKFYTKEGKYYKDKDSKFDLKIK